MVRPEMRDNFSEVLQKCGLSPEDFCINREEHTIYVKDLYFTGQKLGLNWSRMDTEAEWRGWRIVQTDTSGE